MWCFPILCGIVSGLVFSNAMETSTNYTITYGHLGADRNTDKRQSSDSCLPGCCTAADNQLTGCPIRIPLIEEGRIVAARIYREIGNDIPSLACNGACGPWFAGTKFTQGGGGQDPFGSVIINPGCTIYVFQDYNFGGTSMEFSGPAVIPNPKVGGVIKDCGVPCISSFLFTCKQVFPSCTPSDGWQVVTELDNSAATVTAQFSYEKTVGTTFSQSMTVSLGVSATVSAEISASFWDIFSAKLGVSLTTSFDWTKTDTETKSKATSYTVEVTVPPGLKVTIEEAVGTCGGSKVYTQMFKVKDSKTMETLRMNTGKMTNYDLSETK